MFKYKKYNIKNTDKFRPDDYPKVLNELEEITTRVAGLPGIHKGDIIISYLKDHSVKNDWMSANPALAALVTSSDLDTSNLKSLFECCQLNDPFAREFEEFIRKNVS
jgi:hypothetical protein